MGIRMLLFITACLSIPFLHAQKIFYSPEEKTQYDLTGNLIIGKIKNNIIVVKYIEPGKKFMLLVYNSNMRLIKRVPIKFFSPGDRYSLDFVNRQDHFEMIEQSYTNKNYYC